MGGTIGVLGEQRNPWGLYSRGKGGEAASDVLASLLAGREK